MAKELHCSDLGMSCDFKARGNSEDEVLQQAAAHARSVHQINEMTPELKEKVRSAIRTV